MGFFNAEVMNNLGLCCFYSQQYDIALSCFKRALALADKEVAANIWYNLSHVAIVSTSQNSIIVEYIYITLSYDRVVT